jgi:hypothetical protein
MLHGKIGITCVVKSPNDPRELYDEVAAIVGAEPVFRSGSS